MPLDPTGPRCANGHVGCAAAMLSDTCVAAAISAGVGRPVGFDEALDLALDGNPVATGVVAASGRALGTLIATVANLAMPARIIVTGEAVRLATVAARDIAEGIHQHREPLADEVDYVVEPAAATQWARGAAVIAIQRFLLG
jgi:predicted NBD/HSP70 family sugar kinase